MLCSVSLFSDSQSAAERERDEDFSLHTSPETHLAVARTPAQPRTLASLLQGTFFFTFSSGILSSPSHTSGGVSNSSTAQNTKGEVMQITGGRARQRVERGREERGGEFISLEGSKYFFFLLLGPDD